MVNTGRPSAGCKTCRTRRIKCDERKPICFNCRKACRVCLGYRDQLDVIFRDENQSAQRRASNLSTGFETHSHQLYSPVAKSFSIDLDEAVLNQFSRFCILAENNKEGQESLPAVIPSLYGSARSASPCTPAILAMAWVTSAPFASVSQRMATARQKYGEAVVKLRDALRDPRTAKADDALITVLLMLMLENLTATSESMPNPSKHIYGAVMLVNFRGLQNFASNVARILFYFVKVTLTALPAWQKTGNFSFSDEIIEADRVACARCECPSLSTRLGNMAFAIAVLRGKLNKAVLDRSKPQTVRDILQQSRDLDQELMAWRISVPQDWETFSSISPGKPLKDAGSEHSPTWRGFTASYPDLLIAKLLSHFRVHSIAIQAVNIRCVNWINRYGCAELPNPEVQIREDADTAVDSMTNVRAQNVIRTLVDGICASVPFHLNKLTSKGGWKESIGVAIGPKPPAGGVMLLQLLVVAYSAPGVPADQKRWILGKTLEIAKHIGMDEGMVEKVLNGFASG